MLLAIEASNKSLSVAVLKDKQVVAIETMTQTLQHSVYLAPLVDKVIKQAQITMTDLTGIAISQGPGSYTGLRVGVTFAKTLAYTLQIPLFAVSSLRVLAQSALPHTAIVVAFFDARRQNVYVAAYENGQPIIQDTHVAFVDCLAHLKQLNKQYIFISPDIAMYREQIQEQFGDNAICLEGIPTADNVGLLANVAVKDVHTFVPSYLKLAEAEENWLAAHQHVGIDQLVERTNA